MKGSLKKMISIAAIALLVLSMSFITTPLTSATPGVRIEEIGDGKVTRIGGAYRLYVENGSRDWAAIDIEVDIPIEQITELKFWEMIDLLDTTGWDVAVYLGVDTDEDGVFEADIGAWHFSHDPTYLNGDSFVGNDGQLAKPGGLTDDVSWTSVDALATYAWSWSTSPNATGNGLARWGERSITNFTDFLNVLDTPYDDSRIDKGDRVKIIKLVIGGSGSWMNEVAYVKRLRVNGITYDFLSEEIKNEIEAIEDKLDEMSLTLYNVQGALEEIEYKLDGWFDTGGKFSNTAQATSGSGTTTFGSSGSANLYTGNKVGTVTVSLRTTGIGYGERLVIRYYIDPNNPGLYIQKTVALGMNTLGWTDTAAAWKVEIYYTWRSGVDTVSWAYSVIYPP